MEHYPKKNSPHAKFERACDKTTKIDSTFRGTLPMSNFFPLLLTRWDDVSSRWGPLLNLSFFFFPHRPYLWFIYLLFAVYFDFLVGYFFFSHFFFFFLRVWWDDLSSSGSESASTISLLLFSWFALKWKKKRRRHSWIEMKTDGRNALEALRNENDGRMCQNVNGLNSHSICQTMWNN
jgi:hypothetical protein